VTVLATDSERDRIRFLIHTGLRKSEFANLRWKDVDLKAGVITIPRSKNGETRHVPMTSVVRATFGRMPVQSIPHCLCFRAATAPPTHIGRRKPSPRPSERQGSRISASTTSGTRSHLASRWRVWTCSRSKIWVGGRPCPWSSGILTYHRVIEITRSSGWLRGRLNGNWQHRME
jgi:integrase